MAGLNGEHVLESVALKGARNEVVESVKQLLCRMQKNLGNQDYNTVMNYIAYQNGLVIAAQDESADKDATIVVLRKRIKELEQEALSSHLAAPEEDNDAT